PRRFLEAEKRQAQFPLTCSEIGYEALILFAPWCRCGGLPPGVRGSGTHSLNFRKTIRERLPAAFHWQRIPQDFLLKLSGRKPSCPEECPVSAEQSTADNSGWPARMGRKDT